MSVILHENMSFVFKPLLVDCSPHDKQDRLALARVKYQSYNRGENYRATVQLKDSLHVPYSKGKIPPHKHTHTPVSPFQCCIL